MTGPGESLTRDQRASLTSQLLGVLRDWQVPSAEQAQLLGLPVSGVRRLARLRQREPLPDLPETWERVALLLRIDAALQTVFPHNGAAADLWVTTPRRQLSGRRPLDLMLTGGIAGMAQVERSLDNQGPW
jgi:uncharacterized protein (DUF2384 family)